MTCLIVEDEPLAAQILEDYIRQIPFLQLVGKCTDAIFAMEAMHEQQVEVLFLDIHLPGMKGLDFIATLPYPPQIILTTAYNEYALNGFDLGATDYLLKPIEYERFLKAVHKLRRPEKSVALPHRAFHFFNVNKKMVRVWLDEIILIESLKEYVKIYLFDGRSLITKAPLNELEVWLTPHGFWRVHRSFIAAAAHIEAFTATDLSLRDKTVPIGRQYRDEISEKLNRLSTKN